MLDDRRRQMSARVKDPSALPAVETPGSSSQSHPSAKKSLSVTDDSAPTVTRSCILAILPNPADPALSAWAIAKSALPLRRCPDATRRAQDGLRRKANLSFGSDASFLGRVGVFVMSEYLPKEVRAGLEEARKRDIRRRSRMRVMTGDQVFPILRYWEDGFTLDADQVDHLRGLVDVYDGARHISQSLIIASEVAGGELVCTMKRSTAALDRPPLDFVRDDHAPIGLLPRH
jgi:hypothetical protein